MTHTLGGHLQGLVGLLGPGGGAQELIEIEEDFMFVEARLPGTLCGGGGGGGGRGSGSGGGSGSTGGCATTTTIRG